MTEAASVCAAASPADAVISAPPAARAFAVSCADSQACSAQYGQEGSCRNAKCIDCRDDGRDDDQGKDNGTEKVYQYIIHFPFSQNFLKCILYTACQPLTYYKN